MAGFFIAGGSGDAPVLLDDSREAVECAECGARPTVWGTDDEVVFTSCPCDLWSGYTRLW